MHYITLSWYGLCSFSFMPTEVTGIHGIAGLLAGERYTGFNFPTNTHIHADSNNSHKAINMFIFSELIVTVKISL